MPRTKRTGNPDRHHGQYVQLGLTISYYRKLKGMTQQELGDIVGCSRTHISNLEAPKMKTSVSLGVLLDIANALGVPVSKLFETK
jgi:transcriptional regulator with XRE-family HTH domain